MAGKLKLLGYIYKHAYKKYICSNARLCACTAEGLALQICFPLGASLDDIKCLLDRN